MRKRKRKKKWEEKGRREKISRAGRSTCPRRACRLGFLINLTRDISLSLFPLRTLYSATLFYNLPQANGNAYASYFFITSNDLRLPLFLLRLLIANEPREIKPSRDTRVSRALFQTKVRMIQNLLQFFIVNEIVITLKYCYWDICLLNYFHNFSVPSLKRDCRFCLSLFKFDKFIIRIAIFYTINAMPTRIDPVQFSWWTTGEISTAKRWYNETLSCAARTNPEYYMAEPLLIAENFTVSGYVSPDE